MDCLRLGSCSGGIRFNVQKEEESWATSGVYIITNYNSRRNFTEGINALPSTIIESQPSASVHHDLLVRSNPGFGAHGVKHAVFVSHKLSRWSIFD